MASRKATRTNFFFLPSNSSCNNFYPDHSRLKFNSLGIACDVLPTTSAKKPGSEIALVIRDLKVAKKPYRTPTLRILDPSAAKAELEIAGSNADRGHPADVVRAQSTALTERNPSRIPCRGARCPSPIAPGCIVQPRTCVGRTLLSDAFDFDVECIRYLRFWLTHAATGFQSQRPSQKPRTKPGLSDVEGQCPTDTLYSRSRRV